MLKNILIRVATSAERYCGGEQKWWSQPVSRPPCTPNQQAIANYNKFIANYSKLYPGGPIPQNMAKTFDGPPTLERSGSEHRRAVYILPSEEEGLVRGGTPFGKGDGGIRKTPSLTVRKDG